jgi:hypothetical protein
VSALATSIRAHVDWAYECGRYQTSGDPADPADIDGGYVDTRPDGCHERVDIPSISWWWDT